MSTEQTEKEHYEERSPITQRSAWLAVVLFSFFFLGWGLFLHHFIREAPERWDHGELEDVPGQSKYSTLVYTPRKVAPLQIEPLPEAKPLPGGVK